MSEQKQSFMQQLDEWTDATVINPLHEAIMDADEEGWQRCVRQLKEAVRAKVLESYRSGQAASVQRKGDRHGS